MRFSNLPILCAVGLTVSACTNSGAGYRPIVDGPQSSQYATDLSACQSLAAERSYLNDDTKNDALIGAGIGALAGLADNEVSNLTGGVTGLIAGALVGGGASMLNARDQRREIVLRCMKGRGHNVVG